MLELATSGDGSDSIIGPRTAVHGEGDEFFDWHEADMKKIKIAGRIGVEALKGVKFLPDAAGNNQLESASGLYSGHFSLN